MIPPAPEDEPYIKRRDAVCEVMFYWMVMAVVVVVVVWLVDRLVA